MLGPDKHYEVKVVEKTAGPTPGDGDNDWYRYEIRNKTSTITGQRKGTLKQVTRHAEEFADQLNNRPVNASVYASRKKVKPAAKAD